ncbi:MAG: class I SAM-dependent methyltransferase [Candidatus Moranbacteria bacterium]|jgi:SAM-dependent methyltransferase|nr:class I SAM-dependent methyltransferase [Candidatus Moranbacteria bacterium]
MKNKQQTLHTNQENIAAFKKEIKKASNSSNESFLTWFNDNENIDSMISSGYKNFFCSILNKNIYNLTKNNSSQLTAVEIGCGSGRVLNAAAKYFKYVIGLDIHENLNMTKEFLIQLGNKNFELKKIQDKKFPLENNSIDFIYSFIVFQHLLKLETFEEYSREISIKMKKNGLAMIYFGRPRFFSKIILRYKTVNYFLMILDKILFENLYINLFKNGYLEYPNAEANDINLVVSLKKAREIFLSNKLIIIDKGTSPRDNYFGTQYFMALKKK